MAYEFELHMKDLAVAPLKQAHTAYLHDDKPRFHHHLREAEAVIDGIEQLGISQDNPRFLWVDCLNRDWELVASFENIRRPDKLAVVYQSCYNPQLPASSIVLQRDTPYLPDSCTDVFAFYGGDSERAEQTASELETATALYAKLTDGGGAGTALLFRAGLMLCRNEREQARALVARAAEAGGAWTLPLQQALLWQINH